MNIEANNKYAEQNLLKSNIIKTLIKYLILANGQLGNFLIFRGSPMNLWRNFFPAK